MTKVCERCGAPITRRYHAAKMAVTRFCSRRCSAFERQAGWREPFDCRWVGEPNSGCHLWMGPWRASGHGFLKEGGKVHSAHRYAYELANGPVPDGMSVLHHCDVAACVNPRHLYVGTQSDNIADRNRRGRTAKGERAANVKLSKDQIHFIRQVSTNQKAVARELGISVSTICSIRARRTWGHVK